MREAQDGVALFLNVLSHHSRCGSLCTCVDVCVRVCVWCVLRGRSHSSTAQEKDTDLILYCIFPLFCVLLCRPLR